MTYAEFLLLFVVPPIALLGAQLGLRRRLTRRLALALAVTACLAVVCTAPWDSTIISQGVWSYPPGRVLGLAVALVPLEEYAFFVLQVLLTGCLTASLLRPRDLAAVPPRREG